MKSKARLLTLVLLPLAALAGSGTDEVRSGSYAPGGLGQMAQPAPSTESEDSVYQVPAYPAFPVELADGPGRGETEIACSSCHTARYITMQPPLPAPAWEAAVRKMVKTYGAPISDDDAQKIIRYLKAHYTPETRK